MRTIILASLLALSAPAAAVSSLDFESGDTSGWISSGYSGAAGSYAAFAPVTGSFLGYVEGGSAWVYSTLTRVFDLSAGATIHGRVGFQAGDYLPYDDDGYLSVNGVNIFTSSIGVVGDFGNSGWQSFSFTAPVAGLYTLQLGVRNAEDDGYASAAVLDYGAVPEAGTWALMIVGFGFVGFTARSRKGPLSSVTN